MELNLMDPTNQWKPKDHSVKFMHGLRKYTVLDHKESMGNKTFVPKQMHKSLSVQGLNNYAKSANMQAHP